MTSFWVMMSGPTPAARSAVTSVLYSAGSYSLSSTVTSGYFSWNPSARSWNSGVVSRLQPERLRVTGPLDAAGSSAGPPLQAASDSDATAARPTAMASLRFMGATPL